MRRKDYCFRPRMHLWKQLRWQYEEELFASINGWARNWVVHKPPLIPARFIAITKGDCAAVPVAFSWIRWEYQHHLPCQLQTSLTAKQSGILIWDQHSYHNNTLKCGRKVEWRLWQCCDENFRFQRQHWLFHQSYYKGTGDIIYRNLHDDQFHSLEWKGSLHDGA